MLFIDTGLYGMFNFLNIPSFLRKQETRTYYLKKITAFKKANGINNGKRIPRNDQQILTSLISHDINKIEKRIDRLQESIATIQDLKNAIKRNKKDNNE